MGRAQTTSEWRGLTRDQLVTLRRCWRFDNEDRRRGPAPSSLQVFFRSKLNRDRATVFATIYFILSAQPKQCATGEAKPFVSLENGEVLCEALEVYRSWHPDDELEFEYALLLARAVSQEHTVSLSHCSGCRRITMVDGRRSRRGTCAHRALERLISHQGPEQPVIQG